MSTLQTCDAETVRIANTIKNELRAARRSFPKRGGLLVYEPRPTDIIVTTFPKAGTTLTQQLVYQTAVLTGGAPEDDRSGESFSDITEKTPWVNYIHIPGAQPKHYSTPRIFKTHSPAWRFQIEKQKHVVVIRNPLRFPVSWLDFSYGCFPHIAKLSDDHAVKKVLFNDVVKRFIIGQYEDDRDRLSEEDDESDALWANSSDGLGPWFAYTKGWVDEIGHANVLMLTYEDIVGKTDAVVGIVAKFMQRNIDQDVTELVKERCSKKYMMKDDRFKSLWDARILGVDPGSSKVLSNDQRTGFESIKVEDEHLDEIRRQMRLAFGCDTYEQLRVTILERQNLLMLLNG